MEKVRWGVLSVANIGVRIVIPAMQAGQHCEMVAIASRDEARAKEAAQTLGMPRAHGSYEALLEDPQVEAVYNPLPNHMHLEWTRKALQAGKHVLCEKPITMDTAEAEAMLADRDRARRHVMEAFMVRSHPRWLRTRELVQSGALGEIQSLQWMFGITVTDRDNIRMRKETGGGGLLDLGCYPITLSRFVLGQEPQAVSAAIERDPDSGVDRLTTVAMQFPAAQVSFTCGLRFAPVQRFAVYGTDGHLSFDQAITPSADDPTTLLQTNAQGAVSEETLSAVNQYTLQGDEFSQAVRGEAPLRTPLEDAIANMRVIDAVWRAAESGRWETP